ncbi:transmembrane protein, putative (macronuclear) [Tetrahymena thermophila SB210]|uniref:Transmembrane protein, putative n=1 Tax=Tetrahymena thermophila (strain SB210) TaxID=312017 RepID=W7XDS1_TETTS|nr:transmembrane protein, putative [Tetrahymena thermophila SB210]EWS72011.1 transmembrane protein, putative [Tetrahymena thermophila SB210]|eukprot:XP_012655454.1 transmembrane protein, putative [Tetrahymena thermophila SB210]
MFHKNQKQFNVGDQGAMFIGTRLVEDCVNIRILEIGIGENNISLQGVENLFININKLSNLTQLDIGLKDCNIGDQGLFSLIKGLGNCETLTTLKYNQITEVGESSLAIGFSQIKSLLVLDIGLNLNDKILRQKALTNCQNISIIKVSFIQVIFKKRSCDKFCQLGKKDKKISTFHVQILNLEFNYLNQIQLKKYSSINNHYTIQSQKTLLTIELISLKQISKQFLIQTTVNFQLQNKINIICQLIKYNQIDKIPLFKIFICLNLFIIGIILFYFKSYQKIQLIMLFSIQIFNPMVEQNSFQSV